MSENLNKLDHVIPPLKQNAEFKKVDIKILQNKIQRPVSTLHKGTNINTKTC